MSALLAKLDDVVRPIAPAERLGVVRSVVGAFALVYLLARSAALMVSAHQNPADFAPVGLAKLLSAPLPPAVVYVSVVLAIVLSIPFMLGLYFRVTGPAFALLVLWVLGYRNSFGMVFHTENLFVMHVILLAICDSAAGFSLDARRARARGASPVEDARRFGFALQCMGLMTTLAYVLAGVAKLRVSGSEWATGDILRNHIAHDNLRKLLLGDSYSRLGAWAARHTWVFPPFAVLTLVVELVAPIALLHRRVAQVWCLLAWGFHIGVLALMWILFPYQLFFIAYLGFFRVEAWKDRVVSLFRRKVAEDRAQKV